MLRGLVIGLAFFFIVVSVLFFSFNKHEFSTLGGPTLIASSLIALAICTIQPSPKP